MLLMYLLSSGQQLIPVQAPEGAQLLTFPIDRGYISAGFQNEHYLKKNGYPHYGIDISVPSGVAEVRASGEGIVLGTEFCDNGLGNIAVVRYDNVWIPETGETVSLIARYYHMKELWIKTGDHLKPKQMIGRINRYHKWYNHVHLELDRNILEPFTSPQVAEEGSALLSRYSVNGNQLVEPISALVLDRKQDVYLMSTSESCTEKDEPKYRRRT